MKFFPNINQLAKKKNFSFQDFITLGFELIPFSFLVILLSIMASIFHFKTIERINIKSDQQYNIKFNISNFAIMYSADNFFNEIYFIIGEPINTANLLKDFKIDEIVMNDQALIKDFKITKDLTIDNPLKGDHNMVDLSLVISTNNLDNEKKLQNFLLINLIDFSYKEMQDLFIYKIAEEKFTMKGLKLIAANEKDTFEKEKKILADKFAEIAKKDKNILRDQFAEKKKELAIKINQSRESLRKYELELFKSKEKIRQNNENKVVADQIYKLLKGMHENSEQLELEIEAIIVRDNKILQNKLEEAIANNKFEDATHIRELMEVSTASMSKMLDGLEIQFSYLGTADFLKLSSLLESIYDYKKGEDLENKDFLSAQQFSFESLAKSPSKSDLLYYIGQMSELEKKYGTRELDEINNKLNESEELKVSSATIKKDQYSKNKINDQIMRINMLSKYLDKINNRYERLISYENIKVDITKTSQDYSLYLLRYLILSLIAFFMTIYSYLLYAYLKNNNFNL